MKFTVQPNTASPSGCRSFGGKAFGIIFFGLFLLAGLGFTAVIFGEAIKESAPWWWSETPCTITSSGVEETDDDEQPYRAAIRFRFEFDGRVFDGNRVVRSDNGTASFDRARDRAARYPVGSVASCFIDPEQPLTAVLERRFPWIAFAVFFPLIFVAIGGGGLYFTWRGSAAADAPQTESISQTAKPGRGRRVLLIVGAIFSVVGALVFLFLFGLPAVRLAQSTSWQENPCTVVASTVRSWSTDDGTSYRPDIHYEYSIGGRTWRSNRVDFFSALSSGRDGARDVRGRYHVGSEHRCWVDPADPSRSVLDRKFRPKHLFGLLPLLFLFAGVALLHHGRKMPGRPEPEIHEAVAGEIVEHGPIVLKPQISPIGKVLGSLLFALFWNAIVSVFVFQAWKSWDGGHPDWFLSIFLIPFVLVGLASFVFVGHFLLALVNPRPRLKLSNGHPCLGDTLDIEWHFTGRASRIGHLKIILEGREEATYRRGTDTHTDREVFATRVLVDTANDWEVPKGSAGILLPDDTMHSFAGASNKIIWEIKVSGDIDRWPDVNQNFPITIQPLRVEDL